MPALIVFGASGADQARNKADTVRVAQDAESVAKELGSNGGGFTALDLPGDRGKVWVNRDQVRMVREVRGGTD